MRSIDSTPIVCFIVTLGRVRSLTRERSLLIDRSKRSGRLAASISFVRWITVSWIGLVRSLIIWTIRFQRSKWTLRIRRLIYSSSGIISIPGVRIIILTRIWGLVRSRSRITSGDILRITASLQSDNSAIISRLIESHCVIVLPSGFVQIILFAIWTISVLNDTLSTISSSRLLDPIVLLRLWSLQALIWSTQLIRLFWAVGTPTPIRYCLRRNRGIVVVVPVRSVDGRVFVITIVIASRSFETSSQLTIHDESLVTLALLGSHASTIGTVAQAFRDTGTTRCLAVSRITAAYIG